MFDHRTERDFRAQHDSLQSLRPQLLCLTPWPSTKTEDEKSLKGIKIPKQRKDNFKRRGSFKILEVFSYEESHFRIHVYNMVKVSKAHILTLYK